MNAPRRRTLLRAVGLALPVFGAGCLQRPFGSGTAPTTDSEAPTTDDSKTPTRVSVGGSTERTAPPRARTDDLFLANERSDDHRLDVRVTRSTDDGDDERLLYRRYEIPTGSTLEISDLGVVGRRYVVELRRPGGEWQQFVWAVLDCSEWASPTQEPRTPEDDPTLNTDALVRLRDDGLDFLRNECDGIAFSVGRGVPASDHVVKDYASATTTG